MIVLLLLFEIFTFFLSGLSQPCSIEDEPSLACILAWPSAQQSIYKTDINVLKFCFITHTATRFDLQDHLQVVTLMYNRRY
jgi:hypothetical protein